MKVLVLGAGGQGAPCASILARDKSVSELKLGDINLELAVKASDKINKMISREFVIPIRVDAADPEDVASAAKGMDVLVDLVSSEFAHTVMAGAVKAGVNYVNTAWDETHFKDFDKIKGFSLDDKFAMFDDFARQNLTAVMGCGQTSGYASNVIIMYYANKMDSVESVKIRLAKKDTSITEEEEILQPWNPGWNPKVALGDFDLWCVKFEDGKFVIVDEKFSEPELWEFPEPFGKTLVAHHAHEEPFAIPFSLAEKGLKYCDFKYYVNKQVAPIVALGLGSDQYIDVKGVRVKPIDVVVALVKPSADGFLKEDPSTFAYMDKTKYVSVMLEIKGIKDGEKITYLIHVPSMVTPRQVMYDTYGTSLINVALPAAIGAKMAVEGTKKGCYQFQRLRS